MKKINMYRNVITGQANPALTACGNTVGAGSARPTMHWVMVMLVLLLAACSNEQNEPMQPADNGKLQFVVSDFPAFGESGQTRTIGTEDTGKSAWVVGDEILVFFDTEYYGKQVKTLTYTKNENGVHFWSINPSEAFHTLSSASTYTIKA